MMHSSRSRPDGSSNNASSLRRVFVRRVFELVNLGYLRLTPGAFAEAEEPAITGCLVEAIDMVLDDRAQPWMSHFSVHDDPAVNDGKRKGKQRKRVDLRIDSGRFRPRARFRFEAKRLGKRNSVKVYLGSEGLGCFLRGDYARDDDEAGMLGYVQSGDCDHWEQAIGRELTGNPKIYDVLSGLEYFSLALPKSVALKEYRTRHDRSTLGRPIFIFHTLLKFY